MGASVIDARSFHDLDATFVGDDLHVYVCSNAGMRRAWFPNAEWTGRNGDAVFDDVAALARAGLSDPLGSLKLKVPAPLDVLMKGYLQPTTPPQRLIVASPKPGGDPFVTYAALFGTAAAAAGMTLTLDDAIANGYLYDVVISLTYTLPVHTVTPSGI